MIRYGKYDASRPVDGGLGELFESIKGVLTDIGSVLEPAKEVVTIITAKPPAQESQVMTGSPITQSGADTVVAPPMTAGFAPSGLLAIGALAVAAVAYFILGKKKK